MPAMKLTFNAAMRARDVSRPHAEHLASAEAAEASAASSRPAAPAVPADAPEPVDAAGASAVRDGEVLRKAAGGEVFREAAGGEVLREAAGGDGSGPGRPGGTRRRWRSRGSGRGRASSR